MGIINWITLQIKGKPSAPPPAPQHKDVVELFDFNKVYKNKSFILKLRDLTLHDYSGMNHELNALTDLVKTRKVNAKIITATRGGVIVGWALLSKENSNFRFGLSDFDAKRDGALFEIYVHPKHRRTGVGSLLIKKARRHAGSAKLSIAPHDTAGNNFYKKHQSYKQNRLSY